MKSFLTLLAGLTLGTAAHAQWRSTSYTLKPGWSSIYLNGDATYLTPEGHFAAQPDVVEVWRWNQNPDKTQFSSSPSEPSQGTPEWSVWRRGEPLSSDLTLMTGQTAYLVKLRGGALQQTTAIKQRVEPPALRWLRSSANLLGFPTKKSGAAFPAIAGYFTTFPAATASKIYRYNGGALDANNPIRIFSTTTERVDSTQAYWFEASAVSDFMGPLHFELSDPTGLNFGRIGSTVTLTVRNRTAATQTLTFASVNSEAPPAGQTAIAGPVALTRRNFNTGTQQYEDTPFTAPFNVTVAANGTATLTFGVDRTAMSGTPGTFFASILRVTDAANMMDVNLPVSAGSADLSGLWIGDAELSAVESKVPGFTGAGTARTFPLRYLIHVDGNGRATLLSQVYLGILAGAGSTSGVTTTEAGLAPEHKGSAVRLSSAHLPLDRTILTSGSFSGGGTVTGTINLPFNDPTNPFIHQYHPDHDNKNARFQPVAAGVESYTVNRAVTFTFAATPPAGRQGNWGSRFLTGTYAETITGIHKQPVTATGTFTLRRVSENGTLNGGAVWVDPYTPYANNFDAGPGAASLRGSAAIADGAVLLTDALFGQQGAVVLSGVTASPALSGFTARFKVNMGPADNPVPADGISFAAGNLGTESWGESGPGTPGSLAIGFDTYNNGGDGNIGIHVWVNGTHIAANPTNPFTNGVTVPVEVRYDVETGVTVKFNNVTIFNNVATPGLTFPADGRFGFGARTGGATQRAVVDDIGITLR